MRLVYCHVAASLCLLQLLYKLVFRASEQCFQPRTQYQTRVICEPFESSCNVYRDFVAYFYVGLLSAAFIMRGHMQTKTL